MSIISALIMLPFSFMANSALSATTVNTIQGTAPSLSEPLISEIKQGQFSLLGFEFDGTVYDANNLSSLYIDPRLYSPKTLKEAITGKVIQLSSQQAVDKDGDGNFTLSTKESPLTVSVKIFNDSEGDITTETKKFSELVCSGVKPYKAKINVSGDLRLTTEYGDPRNKDYTSTTPETNQQPSKAYEVPIAGICNLKPASMRVYDTGDLSIPGGYNTTKFDTSKGFKVGSGFPTTGFQSAVFSLLGSGGDQSNYRCKSDDDKGKISLSGTASPDLGENCTVTYNSETKGAFTAGGTPTITLEYYNGSIWRQIDSFTISEPSKWALVQSSKKQYGNQSTLGTSNKFPALDDCRKVLGDTTVDTSPTTPIQARDTTLGGKAWRQQYLYRRNELSNSPDANIPEEGSSDPSEFPETHFSRDVDGTFTGEWGFMKDYSAWTVSEWFWTSERAMTLQFTVHAHGRLSSGITAFAGTVCRGE